MIRELRGGSSRRKCRAGTRWALLQRSCTWVSVHAARRSRRRSAVDLWTLRRRYPLAWLAPHGMRIGSALPPCLRQFARNLIDMDLSHLPFARLLFLLIVISPCRSHAGSERTTFFLSNEFFGPMGYNYPEVAWNFQNGMTNMLALWPPADAWMFNVITSRNTGFNFYMQGASQVVGPTGLANSAAEIASQSQSASTICTARG